MRKIVYFLTQILKTIIYIPIMLVMFLIVITAAIFFAITSELVALKKFIYSHIFSTNNFKNKKILYQSMFIEREDYTQTQFIHECDQNGIDPFVAKVFWNYCRENSFLKKAPYKPKLADELDLLDRDSLYIAFSETMLISGCYKNVNYDEIKVVKGFLELVTQGSD